MVDRNADFLPYSSCKAHLQFVCSPLLFVNDKFLIISYSSFNLKRFPSPIGWDLILGNAERERERERERDRQTDRQRQRQRLRDIEREKQERERQREKEREKVRER